MRIENVADLIAETLVQATVYGPGVRSAVGCTDDCRPEVVSGWAGMGVSAESSRTTEVPSWTMVWVCHVEKPCAARKPRCCNRLAACGVVSTGSRGVQSLLGDPIPVIAVHV